jgi:hypothetical protein
MGARPVVRRRSDGLAGDEVCTTVTFEQRIGFATPTAPIRLLGQRFAEPALVTQ